MPIIQYAIIQYRMGLLNNKVTKQYVMQGLISNLIRPFRFRYSIFDLGPKYTDKYDREDNSVLNDRGYRIQYSYYKNKVQTDTCLVYAHCNSGCRIQGLQFLQPILDYGWNLCLFDFSGSGISEGQYISLGYFQCIDLQAIISTMLKQGNNKINLWGRSMGAATIILYLSQTKQIDAIVSCVLDSPYSSLWKVVKQFGKSKTKIPQFIVQHVMEYIRKTIIKQHQFDIKQMDLLKKVHHIDLPIMFIASINDSFVNCSHAAQLYKWASSKQKVLEYIQKQHNSPRQINIIQIGLAFMSKSLIQKQQNKKQLRILSKKKQLCRKMNGTNMAQLITKPTKKSNKSQTISTENLAKFKILANTVKQKKEQVQFNLDRYSKQKSSKSIFSKNQKNQAGNFNLSLTKNPHTIQQSVIKLAHPPKQIFERIKNLKSIQKNEKYHLNSTLNPNVHKNLFQLNLGVNVDKQNNLNQSNKSNNNSENQQQNPRKIDSQIYNFSSIMTKRYHFDKKLFEDASNAKIRLFDRQSPKDKKSKTQKISKLYVKQQLMQQSPTKARGNGIKLINKNMQSKNISTNSHHHHFSQNQLSHQDNAENEVNHRTNEDQHNRGRRRNSIKNRVKTQFATTQQKQYEQDEDKFKDSINILIQNRHEKQRKIKHINLLHNSYSEKSRQSEDRKRDTKMKNTFQKQRQNKKQQARWLCGIDICKETNYNDNTREIISNKFGEELIVLQQENRIKFNRNHENSYHEQLAGTHQKDMEPYSQKSKIELKHFQSIGHLSSSVYYENDKEEEAKQKNMKSCTKANENLNKTHKIIKIQLDRNLLKEYQKQVSGVNESKQQKQHHNINFNINVNLNLNESDIVNPLKSCPYLNPHLLRQQQQYQHQYHQRRNHSQIQIRPSCLQSNPALSKFKLKNRKLLKINTNQSGHSFL